MSDTPVDSEGTPGKSGSSPLNWSPEAQARLRQVPEGVMRELTRQRVEALARRLNQPIVNAELLEAKYGQWAQGSARATSEMAWTAEAKQRMDRAPAFVRGMAVKAIEAYALSRGLAEVTPDIVDEAKALWGEEGRFHQP